MIPLIFALYDVFAYLLVVKGSLFALDLEMYFEKLDVCES